MHNSRLQLPFDVPQIIAAGADLKNALCLTKGRDAFLSQHLGDMANPEVGASHMQMASRLMEALDIHPEVVACDMHPDYFSTRTARSIAKDLGIKSVVPVQHHHAHVASCMAENDLPNEKVIGIALDGTGFGPDGAIWGGEILVADYKGFERAAHFEYVKMPGGDVAAREGWRMAIAYLQLSAVSCRLSALSKIGEDKLLLVRQMITKDINCPRTSSCGRLFDAVAAITGIRMENSFEGQAAMELEQLADESEKGVYESRVTSHESLDVISFAPTIRAILKDLGSGISPGIISMRFHNTIINALSVACDKIGERQTTNDERRVCLSGGCFQNAILVRGLKKSLVDRGFTVYTHSLVPPNDGGIALGQAAIAAHSLGDQNL